MPHAKILSFGDLRSAVQQASVAVVARTQRFRADAARAKRNAASQPKPLIETLRDRCDRWRTACVQEFANPLQVQGLPCKQLPMFSKLLKGHRCGPVCLCVRLQP